MSLLVTLVGALAVDRQHAAVMIGVNKEAREIARVLSSLLLSGSNNLSASSQEIVARLHETQGGDVALVDSNKLIRADVEPSEIGKIFNDDLRDEVGAAIKNRQVYTFVETSPAYPKGIRQIVVPVEGKSGRVIGAVILEYTPLFDDLMKLTRSTTREVVLAGFASVLLAVLIAFYMDRSVAKPLEQLTAMAAGFSSGWTDWPMPLPRRDEIGELATAFNNMVRKRQQAEHELRGMRDELEVHVLERTAELAKSNEALQRQQSELRVLFDLLPAMIWFKDTENGILRVNKRVAEAAGKPVEEIEGKASLEIYPRDAASFYADDLEVIRSRAPKLGIVEVVRDRQGKELWVRTDKVPYCDKSGKVIGILVMAQDVTEIRKAEEELRQSEARFSGAFEHAPIGVALVSPAGRWLKVNRAFCDLVGYSDAELLARTFQEMTHPDDLAADLENVRRLLSGEVRSYQMEKRYIHARGYPVAILLGVSLVRDNEGQPLYFIAQIQDITERKRTEESLRLLGSAVEQSQEAIVITDAELDLPGPKIIFVNPSFTKMTGYTAEEVIGKTPRILQGSRTDKAVLRRLRHNLERGEGFDGETVNYRKDGSEFDLEWKIAPICDAGGKTTHFVAIERDITERKRLEAARDRLVAILESTTDMVSIADSAGRLMYLNRSGRKSLGVGLDEDCTQLSIAEFLPNPATHPILTEGLPAANRDGIWTGETVLLSRSGHQIPVSQVILVHKTRDGAFEFSSTIMRDITDRKLMEKKLLEAVKLETVGRLAGGIAHDFNTILTAIIGHAELIREAVPAGGQEYQSAVQIGRSAVRAAQLTQQLLAFGRKQMIQPELLDMNAIVATEELILRRLLGDGFEIRVALNAKHPHTKADPAQIKEMLVQLALNAQDAMPRGGRLTLETGDVTLDQNYASTHVDVVAGEYVMIAVTDTGMGLSEEVKLRLFDPFFTTKPQGEGSGMGLSMCYGIAKQIGGHISVYSELGSGTTFKIFLPRASAADNSLAGRPQVDAPSARGTESILLVEDDTELRDLAGIVLGKLGYKVHLAANGHDAVDVAGRLANVDLLLTDVVMPKMSGKELANQLKVSRPRMKVLFTSAYTEEAIVHHGILDSGIDFLHKPYTPSALARKAREALNGLRGAERFPVGASFGA